MLVQHTDVPNRGVVLEKERDCHAFQPVSGGLVLFLTVLLCVASSFHPGTGCRPILLSKKNWRCSSESAEKQPRTKVASPDRCRFLLSTTQNLKAARKCMFSTLEKNPNETNVTGGKVESEHNTTARGVV